MATEQLIIRVSEDGTRTVRRSMQDLGSSAKTATSQVSALRGALRGFAALGVAAVLTQATRAAIGFKDALAEVNTLLGDTPGELAKIEKGALQLSSTFGGTAQDQARAYYQAISAGAADASEAQEILTTANQLAVGGATDVFTATDGLTSVLNAYGKSADEAGKVSDALFIAMREGKTTIGELSTSLGRVAPLAASAGVEFDELAATVAALTKGGISTNEAITGTRAVMAAIAKPTSEATQLASALGIEFNAAALESKGLAEFLTEVRDATGGSTEQLAQLFGGVEALVPVLALTGEAGGDLADILDEMGEKAGATQEAFEKMEASPGFQLDRLRQGFTNELISIGSTLLEIITPAVRFLADNMDILAASAQGAAVGMLLLSGPRVISGLQAATVAVRAFTAAIAANPIGFILVAITTAISLLIRFSDQLSVSANGMATLGDVAVVVWNRILSAIEPVLEFLSNVFPQVTAIAQAAFGDIDTSFQGLLQVLASGTDTMVGFFTGSFNAVVAAASNSAAAVANAFIAMFNFVSEKFATFLNNFIDGFNTVSSFLGGGTIGNVSGVSIGEFEGAGETAAEAFSRGYSNSTAATDLVNGIFEEADAIAAARAEDQVFSSAVGGAVQNNGTGVIDGLGGLGGAGGGSGGSGGSGNAALQERNSLLEAQKSLLEEIRGPQEEINTQIQALNMLYQNGAISLEEFTAKMRELNVEATSFSNTIAGGVSNGLARIAEQANNVGSQVSDFVVSAFDQAVDAIVEFATTGELNLREFFSSLFSQLLKLALNQVFSQLVGGFLGGGVGGGGSLLGGLLGFQNGGDFTVGGNDGNPDTQLVAFRATRGEQVSVRTPEQARQEQNGGGTQVVQAPAPNVVVQVGPKEIREALSGDEGDRLVVSAVQRKASTVSKVLNGGST